MGWSQTWQDLMPTIPGSRFQVSLSSFDPFKCTFWARTDKRTYGHALMGPTPLSQVNAKCDVVMKLSVFGTRTDTHTHTRQNSYILATWAVTKTATVCPHQIQLPAQQ